MAITWSIVQLDYALSLDGQTDVVNNSHWQGIPTDDLSNFTPYADITEEEALKWTKDALGAEEVASIEANVTSQLNIIENPTEGSGTPWAA
jgi:hypothetical protein